MFFVILPGAHPDNLGYDLGMEEDVYKRQVWIDGKSRLSCSVLAASIDGHEVTTLEGVELSLIHI